MQSINWKFKVIFNQASGKHVVVSELVSNVQRGVCRIAAVSAICCLLGTMPVHAEDPVTVTVTVNGESHQVTIPKSVVNDLIKGSTDKSIQIGNGSEVSSDDAIAIGEAAKADGHGTGTTLTPF